jgi:uncharacterized protein with ATP-grasp and redox domains
MAYDNNLGGIMEIQQTCIPCLKKSFLRLAEKVTSDESQRTRIVTEGLNIMDEVGVNTYSPYITGRLYNFIRTYIGNNDPYLKEKEETNEIAMTLIDSLGLTSIKKEGQDPLETALRLSIAGNIIDFGLGYDIDESTIQTSIDDSLIRPLFGDSINAFRTAVKEANHILILADNAGEIAFDKLLVNQLPKEKVTYVVKGGPCVNDATMSDAEAVSMKDLVPVIENGAAYQGTILELCSEDFRQTFDQADLIISKGQANFETLSHVKDKAVFYLMRAKCPVIAEAAGCDTGAFVLLNNSKQFN